MQEVDAEPVDLGGELLEAIELGLARTPVVAISPIGADLLDPCQRRTLAPVGDELRLRPARAGEARFEVGENVVADGDAKRLDGACHRLLPICLLGESRPNGRRIKGAPSPLAGEGGAKRRMRGFYRQI